MIGQLDIHDLSCGDKRLYAVNTLFSCGDQLAFPTLAGFDNVEDQNLQLKTDDLTTGVYFVKLIRDDQVFTRRLIIK